MGSLMSSEITVLLDLVGQGRCLAVDYAEAITRVLIRAVFSADVSPTI